MQQYLKRTHQGSPDIPPRTKPKDNLYFPLNRNTCQIRLLKLLPGSEDDDLECEYVVESLWEASDYEAISYVWGDQTQTVPIIFNTHQKPVTLNLFSLLKHFRKAEQGRLLWVDALCINQKDDHEKSYQVGLMGEIYMRCRVCLVWLGIGAEINDAPQAFQLLRDLAGEREEFTVTTEALLALRKIMETPWWSRVWVVQELLLAPKSVLFLGEQAIEWTTLRRAAEFCIGHVHHGRDLLPPGYCNYTLQHVNAIPCQCLDELKRSEDGQHINSFVRILKNLTMLQTRLHSGLRNIGFLELLCSMRGRVASDPRDQIYALLSLLTKPEDRGIIEPLYSLDPVSVYVQSAIKIIRADNSLRLLMLRTTCRNADPGLPSWVPDWQQTSNPLGYGHILLRRACKCPWFEAGRRQINLDCSRTNELILKGLYHDSILSVGDIWSDDCRVIEQWASLAGLPKTWSREAPILKNFRAIFGDDDGEIYDDDLDKVEDMLEHFAREIQASLPHPATGWTLVQGVYIQKEDLIREQFQKLSRCLKEADFLRTLMNDMMCDNTTSIHEGDVRSVRPMYATDIPIVEFYFICKSIGYSASIISKIRSFHRVQNTLNLIGIESRRFFITSKGHVGLGPPDTRVGDRVFLLDGGSWPFLLRPAQDLLNGQNRSGEALSHIEEHYRLVGDCYVQGIMHGEGLCDYPRGWCDVCLR